MQYSGDYEVGNYKMINIGQVKCSLSLDGVTYGNEVSVTSGLDTSIFSCILPGSLSAQSNVTIKLTQVMNPATTTGYLRFFSVLLSDASYKYDQEQNCTLNPV